MGTVDPLYIDTFTRGKPGGQTRGANPLIKPQLTGFPVYSLSDRKFSLCQFTGFEDVSCANVTWQTHSVLEKKLEKLQQICNILDF